MTKSRPGEAPAGARFRSAASRASITLVGASMVFTVWGGPLDGIELPTSRRAHALWIEQADPHAVRLVGAPGRLLHLPHGRRLVYAELTHTICEGCGALHARRDSCVLCGTRLRSA